MVGVVGEAAEFNLWHRISSRASRLPRRYIQTTLPHYIHTRHTYITVKVVACYILALWSHVYI